MVWVFKLELIFFEKRGIHVPEDIAVVGFDSSEEGRRSPKPITSSILPVKDNGRYAATYFNAKFKEEGIPAYQVKAKQFIGQSCGCSLEKKEVQYYKNHLRTEWGTDISEEGFKSVFNSFESNLFEETSLAGYLNTVYSYIYQIKVKEKGKIKAECILLSKKTPVGKKMFYAPRGYLLDYDDLELLKFFTEEFYKYAKERNGLMLKIDPNITYQMRDTNGSEYPDAKKNDKVINDLKSLGYVHYGFNTDIIYTQSRWNYLVKLDVPYDELIKRFSKSTRKNIESSYDKGLCVRVAKKEELKDIEDIFDDEG